MIEQTIQTQGARRRLQEFLPRSQSYDRIGAQVREAMIAMRKPVLAGNGTSRRGDTPTPYRCAGGCGGRVRHPFDLCRACQVVDPTGLGGTLYLRQAVDGEPRTVTLWQYPTTVPLSGILLAWGHLHATDVRVGSVSGGTRTIIVERPT